MGYTHYWYYHPTKGFSNEDWAKICDDAIRLAADPGCPLIVHEYDEPGSKPELGPDRIFFNGEGDDGHETFLLVKRGEGRVYGEKGRFAFCKTAQKPYDKLVVALLAVARQHAPKIIKVSSDGDSEEWSEGLAWASSVLGRPVPDPVERGNSTAA